MKTGEIGYDHNLILCDCGSMPVILWHYMKGTANHLNYFVKCDNCKTRTRFRKNISGAMEDWNNNIKLPKRNLAQ